MYFTCYSWRPVSNSVIRSPKPKGFLPCLLIILHKSGRSLTFFYKRRSQLRERPGQRSRSELEVTSVSWKNCQSIFWSLRRLTATTMNGCGTLPGWGNKGVTSLCWAKRFKLAFYFARESHHAQHTSATITIGSARDGTGLRDVTVNRRKLCLAASLCVVVATGWHDKYSAKWAADVS